MRIFQKLGLLFALLNCGIAASGINISGPIKASTASVTGSVRISSITVSSLTITNLLNVTGKTAGVGESIIQTKFSSTTVPSGTTSTSYQAVAGLRIPISLVNSNDYVRISLSGMLTTGSAGTGAAYLTIMRDDVDLGNTTDNSGLAVCESSFSAAAWSVPVGINITDFPGDTSEHIYQVYIRTSSSSISIGFSSYSAGYFLIEEIRS